jgi:hypothetical protein
MNANPTQYLIIRGVSDTNISHGIDPVTCDDVVTTIKGGVVIVDTRKTLKGAINIRNKKYKNCIIIPSY